METKTTGVEFWTALGKFQQEVPPIKKDSEAGTKFKYKYGSLPHILEAIKKSMFDAGLCFTQPIVMSEGKEYIKTIVVHKESGQALESFVELVKIEFQQMNIIQSKGAIITYLRRYALLSILGLVSDDDDTDVQGETKPKTAERKTDVEETTEVLWLNPEVNKKPNPTWTQAVKYLADGGKIADVKKKYKLSKVNEERLLNEAMTFDDLPFDRESTENESTINFSSNDNSDLNNLKS